MDPHTFRREAERLAAWIADYLEGNERYPVLSRVHPGDIRRQLPSAPPEEPEPFEQVFADFERVLVPGLTHWNHPGFFAYFAISASAPGILAEFLSAALNQQAMLWRTSPAATELEQVTLDWLRQLIGLPQDFQGVIYDTASVSTLHALAAARQQKYPEARLEGLWQGSPMTIYTSEQAHNSIDKAVILLGMGHRWLRKIPTDERFRMRPDKLREAIESDRSQGYRPLAVMATVGTTSTTSIDPVPEIAAICREQGLWLHVDAAYAGSAAVADEYRWILQGCEQADSLVLNPHKWLYTPFDLSVLYVRDLDNLKATFSLLAEYLKTPEQDVLNLMDTGIQLGRRFRSLKLWAVLRCFGKRRLAAMITHACRLAQHFAQRVQQDPHWELMAPTPLSTVVFRARNADNLALLEAVNATGEVFLSHTSVNGQIALRLAVGHLKTERRHVDKAWELLNRCLSKR